MIYSNLRTGIARLMTVLWVILWPASMLLNIWVFISLGFIKGEHNEMIYFLLALISYSLTIGNRKVISEKLDESPFTTLFDWVVILATPYAILWAIVTAHQHGETMQIIPAGIILIYIFIAWSLVRGLIWVTNGFFQKN